MTRDEMLAQSKMFSERFGDSHRVPIEETLPISVEKAQELWSLGIPVLVLATQAIQITLNLITGLL